MMLFSTEELEFLYNKVKESMSDYRFEHTAGVERAAIALGELYMPNRIDELRAAALLHDITKELSDDTQNDLLSKCGFELTVNERLSKPIHHSYTAPIVIKRDFPEYATENVLSAVLKHTVLDPEISLFDEIIYVADFIEESRSYKACIEMRDYVISSLTDNTEKNTMLIHKATLKILDFTLDFINKKGLYVVDKTVLAKEALELKIRQI